MKFVHCLVCDSASNTPILTNTQDPFVKKIGTTQTSYVTCNDCGFVYQNPTLDTDELEALYSTDYYDNKGQTISEGYRKKKEEYAQHSFDWIKSVFPIDQINENPNILDIGSNTGAFLSLFQKQGWNCHAVEASKNMCEIAKDTYNLEQIHNTLFQTGTFPPEHFSFVSLLHRREHLEYPEKILQDIYSVLKPNGHLYIEVPDIFRPKSALYTSYFAAPHLYTFSQQSLQRLLARNGFKTIHSGSVPRGICILAQKSEPENVTLSDDPIQVAQCISQYKAQHDKDAFVYKYIANSLPAKVLIKLKLPWISQVLAKFREHVRVNKII
ncbi:class I SAM-dependent methyltransferase [Candidatus Uhrbacteria bacterium]|nr:class I SAM-dependent methyltransferase [Candidatus Uhrbacteria bacterium]